MSLKLALQNWDILAGQFCAIAHTAYTSERILAEGQGAYTQEEWERARKAGYNAAGLNSTALDTETGFLHRAFGIELRKVVSGLRMAHYLEKTAVTSVLEVGCGEMITSWAIKSRLPHLRVTATDYDAFVVSKCQKLPLLDPLEKDCLNIDDVTVDYLRRHQVILAWDVFYAFDSPRLLVFLTKLKAAKTRLVVCSSQIIGPLRAFSYFIKSRLHRYDAACRRGAMRDHGFKCTIGHYQKLAASVGLRCKKVSMPDPCERTGDLYVFVQFE